MTTERNPTIDFRQELRTELKPLELTPDTALATYIRDRLPNATDARAKYLQAKREFHEHNRSES